MTPTPKIRWRDFRFRFFDRNPQIFSAFEAALDELHTMVFDFSDQKRYTLTLHALGELRELLSSYLISRADSLRVPTSTMAMFFPSETGFDAVLTRQLERFKAHAARGIADSDQEFTKQVIAVLAALSIVSLRSRSYFKEHAENSVTTFVSAYLNGAIQDAAMRRLDDVAMEGADHLRDICKALIGNQLYISALTHIQNLEQLANIAIAHRTDVVLSVTMRGLSECLLQNCSRGHAGTHITSHLLESLFRITRTRLNSPLGLDASNVPYSVGPFISPTERSSYAAINIALANAIIDLSQTDQSEELNRIRSLFEELHDRAWLDFAEMGIEAVKKNSFLLHFINSTIEETVRASVHLIRVLEKRPIVGQGPVESSMEQHRHDRFRDELKDKISWETTGIYSRIVPAMFEHRQLAFLGATIELQCLFAFWAMRIDATKVSTDACERISKACSKLQDPEYRDVFASARLAIHIAQIGIYALALGEDAIFRFALFHYRELRSSFQQKYPDAHFVGNFDDARGELLDERPGRSFAMLHPHDAEFYATVTREHIETFFSALG